MKSYTFTQKNNLWMKLDALGFASEVSNKLAFKIRRKKRSKFFDHSSTLIAKPELFPEIALIF